MSILLQSDFESAGFPSTPAPWDSYTHPGDASLSASGVAGNFKNGAYGLLANNLSVDTAYLTKAVAGGSTLAFGLWLKLAAGTAMPGYLLRFNSTDVGMYARLRIYQSASKWYIQSIIYDPNAGATNVSVSYQWYGAGASPQSDLRGVWSWITGKFWYAGPGNTYGTTFSVYGSTGTLITARTLQQVTQGSDSPTFNSVQLGLITGMAGGFSADDFTMTDSAADYPISPVGISTSNRRRRLLLGAA